MLELCPGPTEPSKSSRCDVCGLWTHSTGPEVVHELPHLPWGVRWDIKDGALVWERDRSFGAIAVRFLRGKAVIRGPSDRLLSHLILGAENFRAIP